MPQAKFCYSSQIMTSEGSKVKRVYDVAREMEIRLTYRKYSAHCTSIARAAGILKLLQSDLPMAYYIVEPSDL